MADAKKTTLLKILCIHGYRQTAKSLLQKTWVFQKALRKHAELIYITAPNIISPLPDSEPTNSEDQRGWWLSESDDAQGYEESLSVIKEAFRTQGPFDGVVGFSQGAAMVSIMCALLHQADCPFRFDFAILVAGFKSKFPCHQELLSKQINVPTLHVFGENDRIVVKERSEDLLTCFTDPTILLHPGGHFIAASAPQKQVYIQFLETFKKRKEDANLLK